MVKSPDPEQNLPRSWEVRFIRGARWESKTGPGLRLYQRLMDPLVDLNFNFRRSYRGLKESYGYFTGPLFFGLPVALVYWKGLRVYQSQLDAGKIRYRYRAPEHLRIPPEGLKEQPPWNKEYVAPLRKQETLSKWQLALEHGSRMCPHPVTPDMMKTITDNPEWQKPMLINPNHPIAKGLPKSELGTDPNDRSPSSLPSS